MNTNAGAVQRDLLGAVQRDLLGTARLGLALPEFRQARETWQFDGGWAWVYFGAESDGQLNRPVILADGFSSGPSELGQIWSSWNFGQFPFLSRLIATGRSLIIVGYRERSASMLHHADTVIQVVRRAMSTCARTSDQPVELAVGGYSMGGLVTRYALAKMEDDGEDHHATLYFSYDTPHRGAWIPISLQAFVHFTRGVNPAFSDQINSPAARQLLCRHIENAHGEPGQDPMRKDFLDKLEEVGSWPRIPLKRVGIANGTGNGTGNGCQAGEPALSCTGSWFHGTELDIQSSGVNRRVARLRSRTGYQDVFTTDIPNFDGAPGGVLNSFETLADALNVIQYGDVQVSFPHACFIPTVSSLAINRDIEDYDTLYADINTPGGAILDTELDEVQYSTDKNEGHILMTKEHGEWLLSYL